MRPFSTSCMTAVATKGFVIEAMWKRDRGVTASLALERLDAESVLVDDRPSSTTAMAKPGISCLRRNSSMSGWSLLS